MASDTKINVAAQRPTVNIKEAENVGEEATAAARHYKEQSDTVRFSKHGKFAQPVDAHPVTDAWN